MSTRVEQIRFGVIGAFVALGMVAPANAADVDYSRDVVPILTTHCYPCHGPDAGPRKAELRFDLRPSILEDRDGRPTVVPGRPADSELIARVTAADSDGRMPPPKHGARLSVEQVNTLRSWITNGAPFGEHWAFIPPKKPVLPAVKKAGWSNTPIDPFILHTLEERKLSPAPPAAREIWLRRVTIDLTGLPPTEGERDVFLKDDSPTAYEKVVDRLLASPHYGERWGRHWLDVARYADSGGFETDIFYGTAWRYRDYVIRSFNADKPFDRFVKEQVAGDELYPDDPAARVATGFYAIGPILQEADMVPGKLNYEWLTDSVDATGAAFLGLTLGCARCHDHKYDPIAQAEYFGLQAVFAQSDLVDRTLDGKKLKDTKVALRKTETEFELARKGRGSKPESADPAAYPEIPVRCLGPRPKPLVVKVLHRGELSAAGEQASAGLPARLGHSGKGGTRTALAEWIASDKNPLTARVIVNRIWLGHFGQGLVRTPNDFGTRGERPTHPALLDWLSVDFVEHGWCLKHLHRRIVLSSTYRQSSDAPSDILKSDPDNRFIARFQPRRVEAEVLWDSIRVTAGTLDDTMYGLPIFPPLDEREKIGNYKKWAADSPEAANRRAVYVVTRRSFRFPALGAFDPPDSGSSCPQRDRTVVPTQALTLLNNHGVRDQAMAFATRLLKETDGTPAAVADRAWVRCYGRTITPTEKTESVAFLTAREMAGDTRATAVAELCAALFATNEFLYIP